MLLEKGETRDVGGGRTWTYPSRSDCFACHNLASGRVLGLHGTQINRNGQIELLEERGLFEGDGWLPALSDGRETDSAEMRARSYLAANCGNCHRGNGPAAGLGDLRIDTDFEHAKLCNVPEQSGAAGGIRLVPGKPDASALVQRMRAHDGTRMPPLGSKIVDERGVKWVSDWIASIPVYTCPNFTPIGP